MRTYFFKNDSWYDKPSCDCCEGEWMECYNTDDFITNGSAHSVEECLEQVLIHEGIILEEDVGEYYVYELRDICETDNIQVNIEMFWQK